jgi:hypothetical protein
MPKPISPKGAREDLKPRPLPVADKMRPFANRIKLRANNEQLEVGRAEMAKILAEKEVPPSEAERAIREALDAAANHQLALLRFENRRDATTSALKNLDDLTLKIRELVNAIAVLSPTEKGHLNRKTAHLVKEGFFDTEVFFELINLLRDCLLDLLPSRNANDARRIVERHEGESSPQILRLWESIPTITRNRVERRIEQRIRQRTKRSDSLPCVELLGVLLNLLQKFRPAHRGAPKFLLREYVQDIDRIWLGLNLTARRQYYVGSKHGADNARHVQSLFQKFCDAALASVGDPTEISIRQVSDLKRRRPPKKRKTTKARQAIET